MASVSPWSVAGGKIKRTFLTTRLNCQRNGRRWDALRRSIRSSIKEYWNGLESREAEVIVYRRFSLASFHKCQNKSNFLIIFHTLEKIFLQKISALNRDPL